MALIKLLNPTISQSNTDPTDTSLSHDHMALIKLLNPTISQSKTDPTNTSLSHGHMALILSQSS